MPRAPRVPCQMRQRLDHRGQPRRIRRRPLRQRQPVRCRGMRVRRAGFQPLVARADGMDQRLARVEPGAFQPRHLARHARMIVVADRGGQPVQRALALRLRGRIGEVDEDLAAADLDGIGPHRVAPGQRPSPEADRISNCASCRSARSRPPQSLPEACPRSADSPHADSDWQWRTAAPPPRSAAPACHRVGRACGPPPATRSR